MSSSSAPAFSIGTLHAYLDKWALRATALPKDAEPPQSVRAQKPQAGCLASGHPNRLECVGLGRLLQQTRRMLDWHGPQRF